MAEDQASKPGEGMQRTLKTRHLHMIAIGGTIGISFLTNDGLGTGLFVGGGTTIATAGPLGAMIAFLIVSVMVFFVVTSLGEMAAYLPVSGSFNTYAARYVDPALAFTLGWNYWFQWAISLPSELSAVGIIMQYWINDVQDWVWSIIILGILFLINSTSVRSFGEAEYLLSAIKITAVVIFIAIGFLIAFGGFGQEPLWFTNFTIPGAPFKNGALGIIEVVLIAFFSFGGTELVGIAAGETLDPAKTVPKAIYGTFWRILIFYILSIFVMGLVIPNNDPRLTLGASAGHGLDATVSPFTLVMQKIPLENGKFVADIMNAVILSAVLSAGNSAMYASSRTLMSMAVDGKAPKIFSKVSTRGIPWVALMATMAIASIAFLGIVLGNGLLFEYLIRMTGISGVLTWISICVIHLRFRAAYVKQGKKLSDLPYRAPLFPLGPYIAIFLGLVVIIAVGVSTIYSADCVWRELMIVYFGIPIFFGLLGIYKWLYRSKMIPLEEVDFSKV